MGADQLAAAVTNLGLRYSRSQVTNLEAGRRDGITAGELSALSAALGVPRSLLEYPLGRVDTVEAIPGIEVSPLVALHWVETGRLGASHADVVVPSSDEDARRIERFRRHRELVGTWQMTEGRAEALRRFKGGDAAAELAKLEDEQRAVADHLRDLRDLLRSQGLTPPDLPRSFASSALRRYLGEEEAP